MLKSLKPGQRLLAISLLTMSVLGLLLGTAELMQPKSSAVSVRSKGGVRSQLLNGGDNRLAYLSLEGMISEGEEDNGILPQETNAVTVRKLLYTALEDDSIKGILLRINSPGGTVGMSQELYDAVMTVRKEKPVVVSMGDLAASGGYYTASAADLIYANPGTLTASIGVIIHGMNLEGLLSQKLGVKAVTIKSGKFKDILSPYRAPSSEEMTLLQNLVNDSYQQFLKAVIAGRTEGMMDPKAKADLAKSITAVADGRIVHGEAAMDVGLVDDIGGLQQAEDALRDLAAERFHLKADHLELVKYQTPLDLWEFLGTEGTSPQNLLSLLLGQLLPQQRLAEGIEPFLMRHANQPLWLMETLH